MRWVVLLLMLVAPISLSAHASMESLYHETEGGILIDVGYDPVPPQVGKRFLIDVALREGDETGPLVDYDSVWVRMSRERATYFASGIARSEIGPTTLVITLPEPAEGEMQLSMRFEKDGEAIAEHVFTLPVAPPDEAFTSREYALMVVASVGMLLAVVAIVWTRYAQPRKRDGILRG